MRFWIDGDSCPREALEIALRAHVRGDAQLTVVADRFVPGVKESGAELCLVSHGSGDADDLIIQRAKKGDLALTRDFLLGIKLLEKDITVINDRGKIWKMRELKERAEEAELMKAIRAGGISKKSGRNYNTENLHDFAAALDKIFNS